MSLFVPDSASRNRSASTGDSGLPQHEHKRPRLSESHAETPDAFPVATAAADTQAPTPQTLDSTPVADVHPNHANPDLNTPPRSPTQTALASPTSSKVTINTRPLSSQSSNYTPNESIDHKMIDERTANPPTAELSTETAAQESRPSVEGDGQQLQPVSLSSSASTSPPPIAVAALENDDRDPAHTGWLPAESTALPSQTQLGPTFVQRTFPFAKGLEIGGAHKVVGSLATAFLHGPDITVPLQQVKTWLSDVIVNLGRLDRSALDAEQEFWLNLPQLAMSLLKRDGALPPTLDAHDLVSFFVAFMHLTRLIADVETSRFLTYTGNFDGRLIRNVSTPGYTQQCRWSLASDGIPLYDTFSKAADLDLEYIVDMVAEGMLAADVVGLVNSLSALFEAMSAIFPKKQVLVEQAVTLLQHTGTIIAACAGRIQPDEAHDDEGAVALQHAAMSFWATADGVLDRAIVKQRPWLTIDNCENILTSFEMFVGNLTQSFPQLSNEIVRSSAVDPINFNSKEIATLAPLAWKFSTLRKFIRSGRMELRVSGIGTMAEELVKVFREYIQPANSETPHATVRFMVDFIRNTELVRYIVGIDSHAQIINRSTNVLGFLCVSQSYRDEDTDVIWKTVMESQDARVGAEVLNVLQANFEHLSFAALRHVTTKVVELPFGRLDTAIVDFTFRLLHWTYVKVKDALDDYEHAAGLNLSTLELCVRLLQEANTLRSCSTDIACRIRQFIPEQIKLRMELCALDNGAYLPSGALRDLLHKLCGDIKSHTELACGSTFAVFQIVRHLPPAISIELVREYDVARLIVEDLVHLSKPQNPKNANRTSWDDYDCYFASLPVLIIQTPDCFDRGLLDEIWMNLLSSGQKYPEIRSLAWSAFADVLGLARTANPVLDLVNTQFFPRLESTEFDEAVLRFAQQSVQYQTRISPPQLLQPLDVVAIPGIESIWAIMLGARSENVQAQASDFMIHEHLDSATIVESALPAVEATHVALIERCVGQVIDAASHIGTPHGDGPGAAPVESAIPESAPIAEELRFHRSLFFLRKFLEALKSRPRFMESNSIEIAHLLAALKAEGDPLDLTLQVHNHATLASRPTKWSIGLDNTASEVWQTLSDMTRWTQFTVIYRGARVELKGRDTTLRELNFTPGMVMISKVPGTSELAPGRNARAPSPVDNKVMHHFDDLHKLLDLGNRFAKEVYEFLIMFSSQDDILNQFRAMTHLEEELLPVEKPFRLMYYLRALRSCIEDESFSAQPDTTFLVYAVRIVVATMARLDRLQADFDLRISIVHGLMEAMVLAFRAKVPSDVSRAYISDPASYVKNVFALWSEAQQIKFCSNKTPPPQTLIKVPFEAVIEAMLQNEGVWPEIEQQAFSQLLLTAILKHPLQEVRQAVLDVVFGLTGNGPVKMSAKVNDPRAPRSRFPLEVIEGCQERLWQVLLNVVAEACDYPQSCLEFFDASIAVLKSVGKKMDESQLISLVEQWKPQLLAHKFRQDVGLPLQDHTISSLGKLIIECLRQCPAIRQQVSESDVFARDIFSTFLFPPLSNGTPIGQSEDAPILDPQTRQVLYDLLLALSSSPSTLESVTAELNSDLVPKDYFFQPQTSNERQALRSDVGYAGLKNLSNTCYLNSLFSQLFMNVEFRDLIMGIDIVDESKQKLVVELSKVFAHMQSSYEESVSPESAVDAITQWDGDQIDVTVQMDVDEFFNLLFDRLEFQILDRNIRDKFKAIYGGQLVQQIKSKECEHVSETLEPFSAVQVEIKGKMGLEESLRAYVEGEVLQGENKYSCTGCGKLVDAVKRACLKDVPDHLIFNLKRFDYDIMTGMRCKVNDEFQFPASIDMNPYTLQALTTPESVLQPDTFELVGIIVHSGTAESGHYYSYIRKRPSSNGMERSWVQFNDQDVTNFNPASISDCCFGGIDFGTVQCPKFYSGYMLFYQRKASIESFEQRFTHHDTRNPVRLDVGSELGQYIGQQNELYLRSFVAQDPIHARFVKSILQKLVIGTPEGCSPGHGLESHVITMALEYVSSTSGRWKELPEVEDTLKHLELRAFCCDLCAQEVLRWCLEEENFANSIVRCFYQVSRKAFARLICVCWQCLLASKDKHLEQPEAEGSSSIVRQYEALLADFVRTAYLSWDYMIRHGRAWDQYFAVLSALTKLGNDEAQMVIDEGFLECAMELIHLHVPDATSVKRLKSRYASYLLGKEKNRPYGHSSLVQFVADMIARVAFDAPVDGRNGRAQVGEKFGLLPSEAVLLGIFRPYHMLWLQKIILGGHNLPATDAIVAQIAKYNNLNSELCVCLKDGLLRERQVINAVSFLRPALTFVSEAVSEEVITELVDASLESIETTGGQYGKDYLVYLTQLLAVENSEIPFGPGALQDFLLSGLKFWAPVLLMHPNDMNADVRGETLEFLNEILFVPLENARSNPNSSKYQALLENVGNLLDACASYAQKTFLETRYTDVELDLQVGQANHVLQVVEGYLPFIMNTAEDEEKASRISAVMEELKLKSDGVADEVASTSEWKGPSSDLDVLSEGDLSEAST